MYLKYLEEEKEKSYSSSYLDSGLNKCKSIDDEDCDLISDIMAQKNSDTLKNFENSVYINFDFEGKGSSINSSEIERCFPNEYNSKKSTPSSEKIIFNSKEKDSQKEQKNWLGKKRTLDVKKNDEIESKENQKKKGELTDKQKESNINDNTKEEKISLIC